MQEGFQVIAASEKAEKLYTEVDYGMPTVLLMGAEDVGIDEELLRFATEQVSIPQVALRSSTTAWIINEK